MNSSDVDRFEKLSGQLVGQYEEMTILSKKNPNDAVNKFKLRFINRQIGECNAFLAERNRPFMDFDSFSEDDVPQNSDVVFMLSQYLQCLEKIRADNVVQQYGGWFWRVHGVGAEKADENGFVFIRCSKPKSLKD